MDCNRGTRDVVQAAHEFVQRYVGPDGSIPKTEIFSMGHMLAHCGMYNLRTFLGAYGFKNPGEFESFIRTHAPERLPPAASSVRDEDEAQP